jgi:hypothetical protein
MRARVRTGLVACLLAGPVGCALGQRLVADDGDLADYRAYRVAGHEGVRLARAQHYLDAHPRGTWTQEVRQASQEEEPQYFEAASSSRDRTSEYLADLPHGPHAEAAIALLTAFDAHVEDLATTRLLRDARASEAKLERSSAQRRTVGETILADVASLLDEGVYGVAIGEWPASLRRQLRGLAPETWGRPRRARSEDLFYSVPSRLVRESRLATVDITVDLDHGKAARGMVRGPDLFVHWQEADDVRPRDPTDPKDRASAAVHATELLGGALEARLPAAHCTVTPSSPAELLARRCDGWSVTVTMGESAGDVDVIVVSGPPK